MEKFFYREAGMSIELEIPENIYCPDEDSLLMAKEIMKIGKYIEDTRFLEIGCGSGFLSILASKLGAVVTAVDINEDAVSTTKSNSLANNADVNAFQSNLFEKIEGEFDFIIFNSPYLPDVDKGISGREAWSMHQNGNAIEKFIEQAKKHLAPTGKILLLFSSLSGDIPALLIKNSLTHRIVSRKKLDFEELFVIESELL